MRVLLGAIIALVLPGGAAACPILATEPFKLRAVRAAANEWAGDIFLHEWAPGAVLTIRWQTPMHLLSANHADVLELKPASAVIVLQQSVRAGRQNACMRSRSRACVCASKTTPPLVS
jgi:hypothetical protein